MKGRCSTPGNAPAPRPALRDLEGAGRDLASLRGRIVVLNFWATWCLPCREEMPVLVSLQDRYAQQGVQVVAVSTDEEGALRRVRRFARRQKLDDAAAVWVGATTSDMERLGLGRSIPATAILDRDGAVAGRILGVVDRADLERRIEWLLGDRAAAPPPALVDNLAAHDHQHGAEQERHAGHEQGEEDHAHGGVGMEGASLVPS